MALGGKNVRQVAWYLFAGVSSAALELALFQLLYAALGLNVAVANVIAIAVATVYNFLVNRNATFKATGDGRRSAVRYLVLLAANMAVSSAAISAMVAAGIDSLIAKPIMQACVATWNFFLYRSFVFK